MRLRSLLVLASSILSLSVHAQGTEGIIREGSGARRASLNDLELKPFASDLWSGVDAWANGTAITSGETSGKPVMIVTWQSWYDPSVRTLVAAQRVADQFASDGLIVIGLHDDQEWAGAEEAAKAKGITVRLGHDVGNKVRAALMVDQDPDVYVIDRAGQLRFADVDSASMEQAAKIVCKESAEDAAKINETLAERDRQAKIRSQSTSSINPDADLTSIPELPFPDVAPEKYDAAGWPKMTDSSGRQNEVPTLVVPTEGWFPNQAPATKGRVLIAYLWNPDVPASVNLVKDMDLIQRERGRDVAVLGIVVTRNTLSGSRSSSQTEEEQALELETLNRRIKHFADNNNRLAHPITFDSSGTLLSFRATTRSLRRGRSSPLLMASCAGGAMRGAPRSGRPSTTRSRATPA
jgi:hypothetical protein